MYINKYIKPLSFFFYSFVASESEKEFEWRAQKEMILFIEEVHTKNIQ